MGDDHARLASPLRPAGLYGCSKAWGEALGRYYADAHGLFVICLRIGHVTAADRAVSPRDFSVWCSQRDFARMFEACIAAPAALSFDVFFVVSNSRWGYRDLAHAREVLGRVPLDVAEDHRKRQPGVGLVAGGTARALYGARNEA